MVEQQLAAAESELPVFSEFVAGRERLLVCYATGSVVGSVACSRIVASETGSTPGRIVLRDSAVGMSGSERGFVAAETDLAIVVFVSGDLLSGCCDSEPALVYVLRLAVVYIFELVAAADLNYSVVELGEVFSVLIIFVSLELWS